MSASRTSRIRAAAVAGIPIAAILVATMGTGARADVDSVRATGYGARVSLLGADVLAPTPDPTVSPPLLIADETGPATNDPPSASAVNVGVPGLLTIGVLSSDSVAQGIPGDNHLGFVSNETRVAGVALGSVAPLVPGLAIDAVNTVCRSDGNGSVGSTEIIGGFVGPTPLIQSPTANTQIDILGLARLTLNEQIEVNTPPSGGNPGFTSIIVRGVVLRVPSFDGSVATVILAESQCSATGPDVLAPPTTTTSTTSTTVAPTTTTSTTVVGPTTTTSTTVAPTTTTSTTTTSTTVVGPTTTSTTILQGCNAATNSGGAGTTVTAHELGQAGPLSFQFTYDTQSVPDDIVIRYEGNVVFTTNGPVSTNGDVTTTVTLPAGTSTKVEVTVIGPSGTVWDYTVNCPGPGQTTTTSPTTTVVGSTTSSPTTVASTTTVAPATTVAPTTTVAPATTSTTLAPVVTVPGGTTLPVATTVTTRAPTVAAPLARTGSNLLPLVGLGMLAIALGAVVRRSEQGLTPIRDTATQPVAPPLPPEFRPLDDAPSANRRRTGMSPLDPATSDALSAFEADDSHDEPDPPAGG